MADLSDDMTDEDVSSVKFLFGNRLPRERMEKAKVRQKILFFLFCLAPTWVFNVKSPD